MSQQQITTPDKSPGEQRYSAEFNSEKAVINNNANDALSKADGGDVESSIGLKGASLILENADGNFEGQIRGDAQFGVIVAGSDDNINVNRPVTIAGTVSINSADTYGMKFQSAAVGDFLRLVAETDVNGNPIFTIGTTPLDVEEYNEKFTSTSDVTLTTGYQNIIQGTVVNEYRDGTSSALYDFEVQNSSNTDQEIQFSITSNNGAVTEVFTATIPRNQSGQNGSAVISGSDSVDGGTIAAGSTVEIKVKSTTANGLIVKGTTHTTTLTMSQNASIKPGADSGSVSLSGGNTTSKAIGNTLVIYLEDSATYTFPLISGLSSTSYFISIRNISGGTATLNMSGSDTVDGFSSFEFLDNEFAKFDFYSTTQIRLIA